MAPRSSTRHGARRQRSASASTLTQPRSGKRPHVPPDPRAVAACRTRCSSPRTPRASHPRSIGRADEVTVTLPWGSLLRLVLAGDRRFAGELARALRLAGRVRIVVSVEDRDRAAIGGAVADADLDALAIALEAAGLDVPERRPVTADDMASMRSSWARRLGIPARRAATLLVARKSSAVPGPTSPSPSGRDHGLEVSVG